MKGFYITGSNGSYVELEDGRYADTVVGETSESASPGGALDELCNMDVEWVSKEEWQVWSNYYDDILSIEEYVWAY